MSESDNPKDLDYAQARLAYRIIEVLLEHTRVTHDLIALMAQVMDEDSTRALTNTPNWTAYLDSKRAMEKIKPDMEEFSNILTRLADENR
jgi:hypothetical protein